MTALQHAAPDGCINPRKNNSYCDRRELLLAGQAKTQSPFERQVWLV